MNKERKENIKEFVKLARKKTATPFVPKSQYRKYNVTRMKKGAKRRG